MSSQHGLPLMALQRQCHGIAGPLLTFASAPICISEAACSPQRGDATLLGEPAALAAIEQCQLLSIEQGTSHDSNQKVIIQSLVKEGGFGLLSCRHGARLGEAAADWRLMRQCCCACWHTEQSALLPSISRPSSTCQNVPQAMVNPLSHKKRG